MNRNAKAGALALLAALTVGGCDSKSATGAPDHAPEYPRVVGAGEARAAAEPGLSAEGASAVAGRSPGTARGKAGAGGLGGSSGLGLTGSFPVTGPGDLGRGVSAEARRSKTAGDR
jgi:hypothetical protein